MKLLKKAMIKEKKNKWKDLIIRRTKNRNLLKSKTKNIAISNTQILLYSICSFWVNMICVITYTQNIVLLLVAFTMVYTIENFTPFSSSGTTLFIGISSYIFYMKSVLSNRNHPDELEEILEKIATPGIFEKFLYAKRTARVHERQHRYFQRKDSKKK